MVGDDLPQAPAGDEPAPDSPRTEDASVSPATGDVPRILSQIENGDGQAVEQLLPLVYDELRKLAAARMAQEKPGQTLQATALVHEAYMRLVRVESGQNWTSRGHFFSAAAEAMRRILVENARRKLGDKHGGQWRRVELTDARLGVHTPPDDVLWITETLDQLAASDPHTAELIKLHCFAGVSIEQAAELLGISPRTAYRDWSYARAWLYRILQRDRPSKAN